MLGKKITTSLLAEYVGSTDVQNLIGLFASRCNICFAPFVTFKNRCVHCSFQKVGERALALDNKSLWHQTCEPTIPISQKTYQDFAFLLEAKCFALGHTRRIETAIVKENQQVLVCLAPCRGCGPKLSKRINLMFDDLTGTKWHFISLLKAREATGLEQKIPKQLYYIDVNSQGMAMLQIDIQTIVVGGKYFIVFDCEPSFDVCFGDCALCSTGVVHAAFIGCYRRHFGTYLRGVSKLEKGATHITFFLYDGVPCKTKVAARVYLSKHRK